MTKKKWIQKAVKRPGALTTYAKRHGGTTKAGRISKTWARREQKKLRGMRKRTVAQTRRLRQVNLYLNQFAK